MNERISTFVGREGDTLLKTLFRHAPQTDTVFLGQTTPSLLAGHEDDPLLQTAAFRRCLQEYTAAHASGVLNEDKHLFWRLSSTGDFRAELLIEGDFTELFCLSGTEQTLFHFLCFVHRAAFWRTLNERIGAPTPPDALYVANFVEFLDEHIDVRPYLACATGIGCDVYLFVPDEASLRRVQ